jgi:hypothetical protein
MHSLAVIGPGKVLAGANHQEFSSLPVRDRLVNASVFERTGLSCEAARVYCRIHLRDSQPVGQTFQLH